MEPKTREESVDPALDEPDDLADPTDEVPVVRLDDSVAPAAGSTAGTAGTGAAPPVAGATPPAPGPGDDRANGASAAAADVDAGPADATDRYADAGPADADADARAVDADAGVADADALDARAVDADAGPADADALDARAVDPDAGVADADALDADADLADVTDPGAAERDDDEAQPDEWGGLTPLEPDHLAALDPAELEDGLVDDEGEIVELVESDGTGPASTRTAGDLTAGTILRTRTRPPRSGWRRWIYELTGGRVNPRLSRSERARADQLTTIRSLVTQPRRITVLSRKGGVGKTTTTLMLGQTLAAERGDRIVAVDGNPDAGSLGYRVGMHTPGATITEVLGEIEGIERYADMRRFTGQTAAGLEVLMSDDDPHISTALGEQEYTAVLSLLDRFYNLILIDTGTGILDNAVQGILDGTDQIVLVVAPSLDAARAASQTLDWLTEHGFVGLVESAVTVINQARRSSLVDVARIEEHFWDRCGATVRVPWDRYLEAGAETDLEDLQPATREAYLQLAAAVARRFET